MSAVQVKSESNDTSPSKLHELFGVDLRSVALFRVGLATIVLMDLLQRLTDLEAHYTDSGVFPRTVAIEANQNPFQISFQLISPSWQIQAVIFGFGIMFALLMLIGYRSRFTTFLTWAFMISLQGRFYLILHGGDILLRILLFWCMFLPSGAYYSVDRALSRKRPRETQHLSFGTVAVLVQLAAVYIITVIARTHPSWHEEGTAVFYALSNDVYGKPAAKIFLEFVSFETTRWLTWFTMKFEFYGPFFAFVPIATGYFRLLVYCLFTGMHLFFASLLSIGLFSYISCVGWFVYLPALFWKFVCKALRFHERPSLQLHFRQGDETAEKLTRLAAVFLFVRGEESFPTDELEARRRWRVRDEQGNSYYGFDALLSLFESSKVYTPISFLCRARLCRAFGAAIYEFLAHLPGPTRFLTSRLRFRPIRVRTGIVANLLAIHFLILGLMWAIKETKQFGLRRIPDAIGWSGQLTRIDQKWHMFRVPAYDIGWHVFPGELANGTMVDLFQGHPDGSVGGPLTWKEPTYIAATYRNWRWQKYLDLITDEKFKQFRTHYGGWLCRNWARHHSGGETLLKFKMVYVYRNLLPDGTRGKLKRNTFYAHKCKHEEQQERLRKRWNPAYRK